MSSLFDHSKRVKAVKPEVVDQPQLPPKFRIFPAGYGGTIDLKHPDIPHIGTYSCQSTLGVYFRVDKKRCFVAHIWPTILSPNLGGSDLRVHTDLGRTDLRCIIKKKLDEESQFHRWPPRSRRMRHSLVMVCKQQGTDPLVHGDTVVGNVAAEAVAEWLSGLSDPTGESGDMKKPLRYGGFLIDGSGEVVEYCDHAFPMDERMEVTERTVHSHWYPIIQEV